MKRKKDNGQSDGSGRLANLLRKKEDATLITCPKLTDNSRCKKLSPLLKGIGGKGFSRVTGCKGLNNCEYYKELKSR